MLTKDKKVDDWTDAQISWYSRSNWQEFKIEGELRSETQTTLSD
jgi:hypothetical protein